MNYSGITGQVFLFELMHVHEFKREIGKKSAMPACPREIGTVLESWSHALHGALITIVFGAGSGPWGPGLSHVRYCEPRW